MTRPNPTGPRPARGAMLAAAFGAAVLAAAPTRGQIAVTTAATLLDRVQIEDLITSYYYNLPALFERSYTRRRDYDPSK